MKTIKMTAVIGVCEGYGHSNNTNVAFESLYQDAAAEEFAESGTYVSAVITPTRTVYHKDWCCPDGGEVTYEVTATANPEYVTDMEAWKEAALRVVKSLKCVLKQTTVTVEFSEVDLIYLDEKYEEEEQQRRRDEAYSRRESMSYK